MTSYSNPNTRAIVSALKSDLPAMRAAAVREVDEVLSKRKGMSPRAAVMLAFGASRNTAKTILSVHELVTEHRKRPPQRGAAPRRSGVRGRRKRRKKVGDE